MKHHNKNLTNDDFYTYFINKVTTWSADTSKLRGGNLLLELWNAGKGWEAGCAVNWLPNWLKSAKPPETIHDVKVLLFYSV